MLLMGELKNNFLKSLASRVTKFVRLLLNSSNNNDNEANNDDDGNDNSYNNSNSSNNDSNYNNNNNAPWPQTVSPIMLVRLAAAAAWQNSFECKKAF